MVLLAFNSVCSSILATEVASCKHYSARKRWWSPDNIISQWGLWTVMCVGSFIISFSLRARVTISFGETVHRTRATSACVLVTVSVKWNSCVRVNVDVWWPTCCGWDYLLITGQYISGNELNTTIKKFLWVFNVVSRMCSAWRNTSRSVKGYNCGWLV